MSSPNPETRSIVIERDIPFPPERIWRALTEPHLIEEWLMANEFKPEVGHRFELSAEWGSVTCEIRSVEQHRSLSYSWGDHDLDSVVTWTLTPTDSGTRLRMEQSGFRPDQPRYFGGARAGWPHFLDRLEQVVARMD